MSKFSWAAHVIGNAMSVPKKTKCPRKSVVQIYTMSETHSDQNVYLAGWLSQTKRASRQQHMTYAVLQHAMHTFPAVP